MHSNNKNVMALKRSSSTASSSSTSLTPQMKSTSVVANSIHNNNVKLKTKKTTTHSRNYSRRNQNQKIAKNLNKPVSTITSSSVNGNPLDRLTSATPYPVSPLSQHQAPSKYWRGVNGTNTSNSNNQNHNQSQTHNHNPYRTKINASGGINNKINNHIYQYHHSHHPHGKTHHGNKTFVKNTGKMTKSKPNNNHHNRFRYNSNGGGNGNPQNLASKFNQQESKEKENWPWLRDEKLDAVLTNELTSSLEAHGVFESNDGATKRLKVLSSLKKLIIEWSNENLSPDIGKNSNLDERGPNQNSNDGADQQKQNQDKCTSTIKIPQLISFGSFRLGVHHPTADLDVLALCPSHSTRDKFFSSLVVRLNRDSRVEGLHPIPGAYTPVIKLYMDDIAIDLVFVGLVDDSKLAVSYDKNEDSINENTMHSSFASGVNDNEDTSIDIRGDSNIAIKNESGHEALSPLSTMMEPQRFEFQLDDSMLIGLDEPSVRSLNGVRVAQHLLMLVPDLTNFRLVLKTIKAWALIHGLYSNVLGFLGGINWAILVSYICMRNEKASPPQLLCKFFRTFSRWSWPKPVKLAPVSNDPPIGVTPLQVWNPAINPRDGAHIMPIITPIYPSMNSSYNVGQSQLRRLKEEMCRAVHTMTKIVDKYDTNETNSDCIKSENRHCWDDLLKGNDFFHSHIHYLHVTICSINAAHFRSWFGFCESRLRILIAGLESPELGVQAYPFAKFFGPDNDRGDGGVVNKEGGNGKKVHSSTRTMKSSFFIALRFAYGVESIDLKGCTEEFAYKVNSWVERKDTMDVTIDHVLQSQLPSYVFESCQSTDEVIPEGNDENINNSPFKKIEIGVVQQERLIKNTGEISDTAHHGTDTGQQSSSSNTANRMMTASVNPSPLKKHRSM